MKEPFRIHANASIATPRFHSKEDAELFMACLRECRQFPPEKWIYPYRINGDGLAVINDVYSNAPFELQYSYCETPKVVDVTQ